MLGTITLVRILYMFTAISHMLLPYHICYYHITYVSYHIIYVYYHITYINYHITYVYYHITYFYYHIPYAYYHITYISYHITYMSYHITLSANISQLLVTMRVIDCYCWIFSTKRDSKWSGTAINWHCYSSSRLICRLVAV